MTLSIARPLPLLFTLLAAATLSLSPARAANDDQNDQQLFKDIHWVEGPATVDLGAVGKLTVPPGFRFADAQGARNWSLLTRNPPADEIGVLTPPLEQLADDTKSWFVLFNFDEVGYVKDDETLDDSTIDSLLAHVKSATEASNKERASHGWPTLNIEGWSQKPHYDPVTHHLTWAIAARDQSNVPIVNCQSRVLGRRGVLRVTMVAGPAIAQSNMNNYNTIISGITFNPGGTYQEFRPGDKVAEYGLIGLISGGAAVAAIKLWKPLLAFGAMIVAGITSTFKKIKRKLFGSRNTA